MKGKRGQGLTMNTIIIAALVLFVLVIMLLIFTGRIAIFGAGLKNCPNTGGYCSFDVKCDDLENINDWRDVFSDINNDKKPDAVADRPVDVGEEDKIGCGSGYKYCCRGIGAGRTSTS